MLSIYKTGGLQKMNNKCDFCKQEFNKDYECKCPTCGTEVKRMSNSFKIALKEITKLKTKRISKVTFSA